MSYIKLDSIIFISNLLVIIGALNWLGVGLTNTDYVTKLIGHEYSKYVFILVGLAGVYLAYKMKKTEHMSGCEIINGKLVCN